MVLLRYLFICRLVRDAHRKGANIILIQVCAWEAWDIYISCRSMRAEYIFKAVLWLWCVYFMNFYSGPWGHLFVLTLECFILLQMLNVVNQTGVDVCLGQFRYLGTWEEGNWNIMGYLYPLRVKRQTYSSLFWMLIYSFFIYFSFYFFNKHIRFLVHRVFFFWFSRLKE